MLLAAHTPALLERITHGPDLDADTPYFPGIADHARRGVAAALAFIHREDLMPGSSVAAPAADDPAALCLAARAKDIDKMQADGVIDWVAPVADHGPARRARVVLPNPDGHWPPGITVQAEVVTAVSEAPLVVDNRALQEIEGKPSVFVRSGGRFEVHPVVLGRSDGRVTEVLGVLESGAVYVTVNSYLLKAELEKSGAEHGH